MDEDVAAREGSLHLAPWAAEMRILFSPGGMIDDKGTINQTFFKPKHVSIISEEMRAGQPVKRELHAVKREPMQPSKS